MASRDNSSTLSSDSARQDSSADSSDSSLSHERGYQSASRGSGTDANSDTDRLEDAENRLDKTIEDTFPASDAPSTNPLTGVGRADEQLYGDDAPSVSSSSAASSSKDVDFKNDPAAQFAYGREVESRTHHFDTTSDRLYKGNPDIGEVDLGTIEADRPAQKDDNDHFDTSGPGAERDRGL